MEGQIGVESEEGRGSTFWFTAWMQTAQMPASAICRRISASVLIVHPSSNIGEVLCQQLREAGFDAHAATTTSQANDLLKTNGITVTLIDAKLKQFDALPGDLLRILMTTPQEDVAQNNLARLGFACSVVKPIRPSLLIQAISALLAPVAPTPHEATFIPAKTSTKSGRILLAEDNQINQIVATDLLTNVGYTIHVVNDGQAAVQALAERSYDLVLMDCQMPVMDGLDATRLIREREQSTLQHIPIIALTANASKMDRIRCAEAGMDGYCSKPFSPKVLLDLVAQFLSAAAIEAVVEAMPMQSPVVENDPLNLQTLLESCTQNPAMAMKILEKFQTQVTENVVLLANAFGDQNAAELARLSHALKGTAGIIGAEELRHRLGEMETICRAADLENADNKLAELRREMDRCAQSIPGLISQLKENKQSVRSS